MRTTLDIDEDVLQAAKDLAEVRRSTAGKVLSELARKALEPTPGRPALRNGVPLFPPRTGERPVTVEAVNRLRDED
jgi:hypothetical protein